MLHLTEWKHAFKLDPNKHISEEDLEKLCESETDGIIIGGSDGVTEDKVIDLLMQVRRYTTPCALEVSNLYSIVPGFDYYLIPSVLNTDDAVWVKGLHHRALKEYGHLIDGEEVYAEGYCILNKDSKVAQLTSANTELDEEDVIAYGRMVDKLFHMPIFYMEYSGKFGDPQLVKKVSRTLENSRLFYGGGIETAEQAEEMAKYADTIIVGNVIYKDLNSALQTAKVVKK